MAGTRALVDKVWTLLKEQDEPKIPRALIRRVLVAFFKVAEQELVTGGTIYFKEIGRLETRPRKGYTLRTVIRGKPNIATVKPSLRLWFRMFPKFKKYINIKYHEKLGLIDSSEAHLRKLPNKE